MKYIRHGHLGIVLFSDAVTHSEVASQLGGKVLSAGFAHIDADNIQCHGESISLNLRSDPQDSTLLRAAVGSHGISGR